MNALVLTSTFTADPLLKPLRFLLSEAGITLEVMMTPYNQTSQQLLNPHSELRSNKNGINILLFGPSREPLETKNFDSLLVNAISESEATWLLVSCPLINIPCHFLKHPEISLPNARNLNAPALKNREDTSSFKQAAVPYDKIYFYELAIHLGRVVYEIKSIPKKIIVLDADNTLWPGVCAEIGPENIVLSPAFHRFQEFLLKKRETGFLLALCSKNETVDVKRTFQSHPSWPLQWEDFVTTRVNWNDKSSNIKSISEELSLGLNSFVFLDDNPVECAAVRASLPEVATLQVPEMDIAEWFPNIWALDQSRVTQEDRLRNAQYAREAQRRQLRSQAPTLREFLDGLEMEIRILPLEASTLARAAQLTARTNQFNTTTLRLTEAELQALAKTEEVFTVSVRDRFGDYGMVGLMIHRRTPAALVNRVFLLSCRVLGREVEQKMLEHALARTKSHGLETLQVQFAPSPRNQPALRFFTSAGLQRVGDGFVWNVNAPLPPPITPTLSPPMSSNRKSHAPDFDRLARLSSPTVLLEALRVSRKRPELSTPYVAPANDLEREIARIWSGVLHMERVGTMDNFFDLGGESLHLVEIHRQLAQAHPQLQIVELFQHPTISTLATRLSPDTDSDTKDMIHRTHQRAALQRAAFAKTRNPRA